MTSSSRNNTNAVAALANNNDNLGELGLFHDGLTTKDDSGGGVGVDDIMDECGNDECDDPSSFVIPTLSPPLPINNNNDEQQLLLQQLQQHQGGGQDQNVTLLAPPTNSLTHYYPEAMSMTPAEKVSSQRKHVVFQSSKSNLQFRTDLSKSDRDSHPCGILHFTRIGHGGGSVGGGFAAPEEHVFAWISHFHNPIHLENTLLHLQKFGFSIAYSSPSLEKRTIDPSMHASTTVTFLPYSSRRSWIDKYPYAFPHVYCGGNGVVSGYPYWSEGGSNDNIIRAGSGSGVGYYERMFQPSMNHCHLTSTGDGVGVMAISSSSATGIAASTTTYNATTREANSTEKILTTPLTSSKRGRKKKKLFPTAHLPNEERDELHMEIYKYFEWLHNSLVAASTLTTTMTMEAAGSERSDDDDVLGEKKDRSASLISIGGGRSSTAGGCGGGINISSLNQLIKCMEITFKAIGNSQRTSQRTASSLSSLTDAATASLTITMPFLEEALGEPLRKLAFIAKRNPENQTRSRLKQSRRCSATSTSGVNSAGPDFEDMFERLLRFQQVCQQFCFQIFFIAVKS